MPGGKSWSPLVSSCRRCCPLRRRKSRMNKPHQFELPQSGEVFNLFSEQGQDPVRVIMDNLHAATEKAAAREYELKMQRTFSACPGFIGGDAPETEQGTGYVVVDCSRAIDAVVWL